MPTTYFASALCTLVTWLVVGGMQPRAPCLGADFNMFTGRGSKGPSWKDLSLESAPAAMWQCRLRPALTQVVDLCETDRHTFSGCRRLWVCAAATPPNLETSGF